MVKVLRNIFSVVEPGGYIHIIGWILNDYRLFPIESIAVGLVLLNLYDRGEAYREEQYLPLGIVVNNNDSVELVSDRIIQLPATCV